jgi:hypothetical protein
MKDNDRDDIARYYGFDSFAALLGISHALPMEPGETVQSYCARKADGQWFVWRDEPPPPMKSEPRYPER